jgi:hypothetical protein
METIISSSQSQTSSIGIGEFGMNPRACRGNAAAFSMTVKDVLFPKLKFLQGTNASMDLIMEATQHIPKNNESKQMLEQLGNKQHDTPHHNKTQLLHTNNHDQCQKNDNAHWQNIKQQACQKHTSAARRDITQNRTGATLLLPSIMETIISSSQSQTSNIGISEFGMNPPACRGNAAAFSMTIKDGLFPKLKFLQGTNASFNFIMVATSICGYLRVCCGVSEGDASQLD